MTQSKRGRYTLEFKQEAARLVESGQSQASVARSLGVVEQTLGNWVSQHRAGTLKGAGSKPRVSAEQMENSPLRAGFFLAWGGKGAGATGDGWGEYSMLEVYSQNCPVG